MTGVTPRRAIPGPIIDRLRDGLPDVMLTKPRALQRELVAVAMSFMQRGHSEADYVAAVLARHSRLGTQVVVKNGNRDRHPREVRQQLSKAWKRAGDVIAASPPDAQVAVDNRVALVRELVENADIDMTDVQRRVLAHAADVADQHRTLTPALPMGCQPVCTTAARDGRHHCRDGIIRRAGVGLTAARTALRRLDAAGVLTVAELGRRAGPSAKAPAKATRYRFATRRDLSARYGVTYITNPNNGSVVPSAVVVPHPDAAPMPRGCNAPSANDDPVTSLLRQLTGDDEMAMPTEVRAAAEKARRALLDLAVAAVHAVEEEDATAHPNGAAVIPLRRAAGER